MRRTEKNQLFREEALALIGRKEPVDGLLRVTAPHERVLLAGLGLVVLAVIGWGVLGRIETGLTVRCVFVQSGGEEGEARLSGGVYGRLPADDLRDVFDGGGVWDDGGRGLEVLALLPVADARRLEAGMEARVLASSYALADVETLEAEVSAVVGDARGRPVDLRGRSEADGLFGVDRGYLVRLGLRTAVGEGHFIDGDPCTVRIVTDRRPPVVWLLSSGRS